MAGVLNNFDRICNLTSGILSNFMIRLFVSYFQNALLFFDGSALLLLLQILVVMLHLQNNILP